MANQSDLTPDQIKIKQQCTLFILGSVVTFLLLVLYWLMSSETAQTKDQKKMEAISFAEASDQISLQSIWMEKAQHQLKEAQQKTEEMSQQIEELKASKNQSATEVNPKYQALEQQVQTLQNKLDESAKNLEHHSSYSGQNFSNASNGINAQEIGIENDELNLKPKPGTELPKKNPDTFVPAGTFAEAIMLGAADASAGVTSQSNPSPMLFRLIAEGTLPNHKKSHLKSCVVTAAVVGDISSERGEIRLERMSCIFPNGEIVEQPVEGTVFGMDAKNGVRGHPLWREGALLGRAAVAGTLSGFANGVSQGYTTHSISPLGNTQAVDNGAIFKYGLASGASNAMEKLAEYNIRRAEQYHPVIQMTAGQPVDVVFLKGFYLDGKKHEDLDAENHTQPELFPNTSSNHQTATGLTLTEKQLEKIKQHENAMGWVRNQNSGEMS